MSRKTKATATRKNGKPALVPKLRFPEFRGAWVPKILETLGYFTGGGTPSKENEAYWTGDIPWISSSDLIEDSISQIRINRFITKQAVQESATKLIPAKSILLISRVGVGKLAVSALPLCTSQDFTNFTPTAADPLFLAYFLKSRKQTLLSFNQGTSIKGFTKDNIATLELGFPTPAEQQKIASCLSSVDELIAAQARKLDALKTHKKGLMQQLFPREGETQPRLRFPEFQNAGDWTSAPLGQLLASSPDYGVNAAAVPFSERLPKYLRITDISEDGNYLSDKMVSVDIEPTDGNYLDEGDIALTRTGASVGKSYRYRKEDGKLVFAGFLIRIKPAKQKLVSAYLANFLTTDVYWDWVAVTSTRSGQPGLNSTEYNSLLIPLPPGDLSEQQRIADCFTSLDALITAQTQKLEALKTHKKGLMQQLFPSAQEAEA